MLSEIRKEGRRPGPRYKLSRAQMEAVAIAHSESDATVQQIADRFGVSHQTIYNVLRRLRQETRGTAA